MKKTKTQKRPRWLEPRVAILLDIVLEVAGELKKPYAIGGALAMAAHGYQRKTEDVDLFVEFKDRGAWLSALRQRSLLVEPLFAGVQYVAKVPGETDPAIRIDVLVPAEEVELSAIDVPDAMTIAGRPAEVFPLVLLIIAKYKSDRDKDHADVKEMFERGMINVPEVLTVMRRVDEELAQRFVEQYGATS